VQTEERVSCVVRTVKSEDESRRRILDRLQAAQHAGWQTHQNAITVVQTTKDQRYNERLKNRNWNVAPDTSELSYRRETA
jgi:uncharacterized Ntn-hydrolase superfamily protein